jgi:hypothetical protein
LKLSEEFLLVDLVDHLDELSEANTLLMERVRVKARSLNQKRLGKLVRDFGGLRVKKFFGSMMTDVH